MGDGFIGMVLCLFNGYWLYLMGVGFIWLAK